MRRKLHWSEIVALVCLVGLLALTLEDYRAALHAQSCTAPGGGGQHCYPWGTEGPVADYWYYRTKEIYLKANLIFCAFLAVAIAIPFVAPLARVSLAGMFLVLLAHAMFAESIAGLF